jgi:hypothetical protein
MSNASALFRSLLVYGLCLPLAVILGYLLAEPLSSATFITVVTVFVVLAIPPLLRWHHVWLIASWNMTAMLFFVPGKPQLWMGLAAISLGICILQYALNRNLKFLHVPTVARPVLFLTAVVLITARLTGGIGFRVLGGDTYGGRHYVAMLAAVMGYFAIINRRIPPKRAGLYVALYFLGSATVAIANLPGVISPAFNFLFLFFPVANLEAFEPNSVIGPASGSGIMERINGLAFLGLGVFCWMLARYGLRGLLDATKPWRLAVFGLFGVIGLLSGFRSLLLTYIMVLALLFYLERLHHTRLILPVILVSLAGMGVVSLFSSRLPFPVQRSLAILPFLQLDPLARLSAEASNQFRLQVVRDVSVQIPRYLLLGKGYSFSGTEQAQIGGRSSMEGIEMVGDYHNGPLSVIVPFGVFGAIAFLWLLIASLRVLYQNYQFGDPVYHNINTFLFAYFIASVISFFTVFGSLHSDLHTFLGLLALSISLNGGVAKPAVAPRPKIVFNRFKLHPSVRRPVGA